MMIAKADIVTFDECDEVLAFLETPQSRSLHYAFMDIKLRGMLGIELAKRIKDQCPQTRILFCTAYSYYALEAYQLHALGYLMKPVETERLEHALDKVIARGKGNSAPAAPAERIPVEKGGRKVLVPIDQIRYIEAKDDYSCIYTDTDRYLSVISLAQLEAKLSPHGFFRVHRGYIVNLQYVEDVEVVSSGVMQLGIQGVEGKKISVSRRRVVQLKRALGL